MLSVEGAREAIRKGAWLGEVYDLVAEDEREGLREWFCREPGLPNLAARRAAAGAPSGELCPRCGGFMVQTGSCKTCNSCGESSGGCG